MNSIRPLAALATLAIFAAVATAKGPEGAWKGKLDITMPTLPKEMSAEQRQMVQKQIAMVQQMKFDLNLKANKTFTMKVAGGMMKTPQTGEGTWAANGGKIVLTTTKKNGKAVTGNTEKPMNLTVEKGGKLLRAELPGSQAGQASLTFVKG